MLIRRLALAGLFLGMLPEEQVKQWIEAMLSHGAVTEAKQLEASDPAAALCGQHLLGDWIRYDLCPSGS